MHVPNGLLPWANLGELAALYSWVFRANSYFTHGCVAQARASQQSLARSLAGGSTVA